MPLANCQADIPFRAMLHGIEHKFADEVERDFCLLWLEKNNRTIKVEAALLAFARDDVLEQFFRRMPELDKRHAFRRRSVHTAEPHL
jgi:hypothetical protein